MSNFKKPTKSKFITENLLDDPEFSNDSSQKRTVKRQMKTEKDSHNLSECMQTPDKKQKIYEGIDNCGELRQRTLNVMNRHLQTRKAVDDNLVKELTEAIANVECDHQALKDNVQKLEQLTMCSMKCMQQTVAANKETLTALKGIFTTFKKQREEIEAVQINETEKLGVELEQDMNKLKQKLISEAKRSERENLQKSFLIAMNNNNDFQF